MAPLPTEHELLAATLAGKYHIDREIGRGGMGVVFEGVDLTLERKVAIKTLPLHLGNDPQIRTRFLREARTAAALSHPNIVPIFRAEEIGDLVFFVMGLVEGPSVAGLIEKGPLSAQEALPILADVAMALGYAHSRSVIHRDVKAENILLSARDRRAMVTDFGIARLIEAAPMTATGQVLGTVHYMSPEQVTGEKLDGRSDLYALGVLAFRMLCGRFPFERETASAVLVAHVTQPAPPLKSILHDATDALGALVDALLAKSPDDRPPSADIVARRFQALCEDTVTTPERISSARAQQVWERAALMQYARTDDKDPPPLTVLPAPVSNTTGFGINQVRDAAREAGIDTQFVDRALQEQRMVSLTPTPGLRMSDPPSRAYGARTFIEYDIVLEGVVPTNSLEEVAEVLRRAVGVQGSIAAVGRSLTFTSTSTAQAGDGSVLRFLEVTVSTRNGRTIIRASEDLKRLASNVVWGMTAGVGGGVGTAAAAFLITATSAVAPLGVPVGASILGVAYLGARFWYSSLFKRRDREVQQIVQRLAADVQSLIDESNGDRKSLPR